MISRFSNVEQLYITSCESERKPEESLKKNWSSELNLILFLARNSGFSPNVGKITDDGLHMKEGIRIEK